MSRISRACAGRWQIWAPMAALLAGLALLGSAQAQIISGTNFGPIPDGTGPGPLAYGAPRDIRFNVSGQAGSIGSARVFFRANHPWVGDLKVQLIAPDGRSHLLFERSGATTPTSGGFNANLVDSVQYFFGDDFSTVTGTNWWTAADIGDANIGTENLFSSVVAGGDGVTNPAPTTSFDAVFGSADPNGTWILRFEDGWMGDTGEVTDAELILPTAGTARAVSNANDTGAGSLREAMTLAQPGDAIRFSAFFDSPRTISLQSRLPLLPNGVGIFGPTPPFLNVRRSGGAEFRVFQLAQNAQATLSGMTISNGSEPSAQGGGIFSQGRLTVIGCMITENGAQGGAGITQVGGDLTMLRSTVALNFSFNAPGVRIRNDVTGTSDIGTALIDNSTITTQGGDIVAVNVLAQSGRSVELILRNSTLTDNDGGPGKGLQLVSQGAGSTTRATISNTLFANRTANLESLVFSGGTTPVFVSEGFNLATDGGSGFLGQPSDRLNGNAPMGPLLNNGGGVPVHRPQLTSEVLDNGLATGPRLSDQTGIFDRVTDLQDNQYPNAPGGDGSDIGAFELPAAPTDAVFEDGFE